MTNVRRIVAMAAAALCAAGLLGVSAPATAHGPCVAVGTLTITSEGLGVAVVADKPFSFSASGSCLNGGSWSAAGNGYGGCGAASGTATLTITGHTHSGVTFQIFTDSITFTGGGVNGSGHLHADPFECATGRARRLPIEFVA